MGAEVLVVAADGLVLLGLVVTTLGVVGMFRMPDVYTELHAASKAVVLGVVAFLVASVFVGDAAVTTRALLIAVFLILTTPVGAHAIVRAAWLRQEAMRTPGAVDESGRGLSSRGVARESGPSRDRP